MISNYKQEWDEQWKLYSPRFKLWDTDFEEWKNNILKEHLIVNENFLKDKIILDAGCGIGKLTYSLAKICKKIYGVDFSKIAIKKAKSLFRRKNLVYLNADLRKLPFENGKFDVIFSAGVLHHIPEHELAFSELVRCLSGGGILSIWVYNSETSLKVNLLEVYFRKFLTKFNIKNRKKILKIILPFFLLKQIFIKGYKQKSQEKLLHIYDSLFHKEAKRYNVEEIKKLFKKYGLKDLRVGRCDISGFSVRGVKSY
ncbi:MAG: class I SAM-dependent methyltransferase [Nanoarchaeota archaeon]|nr:class I SAM-dependent methyltransferase [Nanoarchaeota archaeon]